MTASNAWSADDIGDQAGRVALITGANSGIGLEAAVALAVHGAHVVLACRDERKAKEAKEDIDGSTPSGSTEVLILDLGDLDSVVEAVVMFRAGHDRLDLLVNNAGLMTTPEGRTAEGFETQFGVNHLGHFALTAALLEPLLATAGSRVVTVSSGAHRMGRVRFDDLQGESGYKPLRAYAKSKLANLLFTNELQRRLAEAGATTIAVAAHPGMARTNLANEDAGGTFTKLMKRVGPALEKRYMQDADMGALPTLRAATDSTAAGGNYYGPGGPNELTGPPVLVPMSARARDENDARLLWAASVRLTGSDYSALS